MLKNPIKRQSWEYLHSDVEQGELLGKGAFGEVRAGKLQLKTGETIEVAIKVVTNGEFVQLPSCCPESLRNFFATKVFVKDPESRVNMTDVVIAFERATGSENSAFRIRRKFMGFMHDVPSSLFLLSWVPLIHCRQFLGEEVTELNEFYDESRSSKPPYEPEQPVAASGQELRMP
ncbi:unnamed protein product [Angiostrongylus costaricensis]|uniref:Protein kinase domain-containing protein n=1 Tax=Angiostrongylus costaricensis TaxID=334426 RepID=A0A0R3PPK4_ANGCS|nr:unnamed protein product [Angiostrongylus costaricensis]